MGKEFTRERLVDFLGSHGAHYLFDSALGPIFQLPLSFWLLVTEDRYNGHYVPNLAKSLTKFIIIWQNEVLPAIFKGDVSHRINFFHHGYGDDLKIYMARALWEKKIIQERGILLRPIRGAVKAKISVKMENGCFPIGKDIKIFSDEDDFLNHAHAKEELDQMFTVFFSYAHQRGLMLSDTRLTIGKSSPGHLFMGIDSFLDGLCFSYEWYRSGGKKQLLALRSPEKIREAIMALIGKKTA